MTEPHLSFVVCCGSFARGHAGGSCDVPNDGSEAKWRALNEVTPSGDGHGQLMSRIQLRIGCGLRSPDIRSEDRSVAERSLVTIQFPGSKTVLCGHK